MLVYLKINFSFFAMSLWSEYGGEVPQRKGSYVSKRQLEASAALDLLSLGPPIQHNELVSSFSIFLPFLFVFGFVFFH